MKTYPLFIVPYMLLVVPMYAYMLYVLLRWRMGDCITSPFTLSKRLRHNTISYGIVYIVVNICTGIVEVFIIRIPWEMTILLRLSAVLLDAIYGGVYGWLVENISMYMGGSRYIRTLMYRYVVYSISSLLFWGVLYVIKLLFLYQYGYIDSIAVYKGIGMAIFTSICGGPLSTYIAKSCRMYLYRY